MMGFKMWILLVSRSICLFTKHKEIGCVFFYFNRGKPNSLAPAYFGNSAFAALFRA